MMDREDIQNFMAKQPELKSQSNMNKDAAIAKLPNEALVEIFAILKNSCAVQSWHQITHVCQHRRYVALEAATLWANPKTVLHDYTLLMLDRSRQSPLDIRLPDRTPTDTSTAVLRQIGRIESLFVYQRKAGLDHMQSILLCLGHEALQLRVLKIIQTSPHDDSVFKLSALTFQRLISLKQILFVAIDLDWQIFPIPSLTVLSLDRMRISNPPSWMQFRNALRAMPMLEQLSFSFDELQLNSCHPSCPEPLQMPLLRRLNIDSGLASIIENFISRTTFPLLQYAYLACTSRNNSDHDDYSAIISASLSLLTRGDFGYLDCLLFANNHFMATQFETPEWSYNRALEFFPPVRITPQASTRMAQDTIARISSLPDIASQLTHLILHMSSVNSDQLPHILGLRQIVTLTTYPCSKLINSLRVPAASLPDVPIAFPMLERLMLLEHTDRDVNYSPLQEELYDCLSSRRAYGSGVSLLCLMWDLSPKEAQRLRDIVDVVECKGYSTTPGVGGDDAEQVVSDDEIM